MCDAYCVTQRLRRFPPRQVPTPAGSRPPVRFTARQFGKWDGRGALRDLAGWDNPPPCFAGPLPWRGWGAGIPLLGGVAAGRGGLPRPLPAGALCFACAKVSCPQPREGEGEGGGANRAGGHRREPRRARRRPYPHPSQDGFLSVPPHPGPLPPGEREQDGRPNSPPSRAGCRVSGGGLCGPAAVAWLVRADSEYCASPVPSGRGAFFTLAPWERVARRACPVFDTGAG